jgi:hypothetical protein
MCSVSRPPRSSIGSSGCSGWPNPCNDRLEEAQQCRTTQRTIGECGNDCGRLVTHNQLQVIGERLSSTVEDEQKVKSIKQMIN